MAQLMRGKSSAAETGCHEHFLDDLLHPSPADAPVIAAEKERTRFLRRIFA
jgi:hypothetical protein